MLKENYEEVQKKITEACKRAGRNREEVTLIAVSKTKPVEMLSEIYDLGERNFGENKVQELTEKEEVLPKDIHWHMIGHLQRNKVKYIAGKVALIHSVDSLRLAKTISEEAVKHNCEIPILIEVNVAGEESKFGVSVEETLPLIEEIAKLPEIACRGGSCVVDPFGHVVSDTIWDQEGIIYAELDMQKVPASKMEHDVCGHYARPDVLKLQVEDK